MKNLSKSNKILLNTISVLMIVVILGITYAAFSQNLNINGSGVVRNSSWDIHIVESGELNPSNELSNSAKVITKPVASATTISNYEVSLTTPGDSISISFSIINDGDYDAKISDFSLPTPNCTGEDTESNNNVCSKLSYTLKYDNGATVQNNDMIASKETKTMVLTLTYQEFNESNLLPTKDVTISNLGFTIKYVQVGGALVESDGTTPYTYQTYNVGDYLTIHDEGYYVISDNNTYVTLLKENPLTVDEVNLYGGAGTENNHVNKYTRESPGTAYDWHTYDYGGMAYYSSETCGYVNGVYVESSCQSENATSYDTSDVKYVVAAWMDDKFNTNELALDTQGYQARLITLEELLNFGYSHIEAYQSSEGIVYYNKTATVPTWVYISWHYWTMSPSNLSYTVWRVLSEGTLVNSHISNNFGPVRPVVNIYKSKI